MIVCFGDSLTEGWMVSPEESYPGLLQQRLRERGYSPRVVNSGVSGITTGQARRTTLEPAARRSPKLVILNLGTNDVLQGVPIPEMEAHLDAIIRRFQEAGARVILGGLRLPGFLDPRLEKEFEALFPRLAERHRLPLIPSFLEGIIGNPRHTFEDGLHPNPAGYRRLMENVWPQGAIQGRPVHPCLATRNDPAHEHGFSPFFRPLRRDLFHAHRQDSNNERWIQNEP